MAEHVWFISLRRPDGTIQPGYWTVDPYTVRHAFAAHDMRLGVLVVDEQELAGTAVIERINNGIHHTEWLGWQLERNVTLTEPERDELLAIMQEGW